jgi:trigger factor
MSIENRLAAKKRAKQAKRKRTRKTIYKVIGICLIPVIICLIAYAVLLNRIEKNAGSDKYINADGTIDGRSAKSYVTMVDYKNITINREDYLPTESEVESSYENVISSFTETVTDAGTEIDEDSTVALTYTVTADGEELTDYEASGSSYILGTQTYGEEFDAEIAALTVGDSFTIDTTFDDDYDDENLAGKTVVFAGTIDSVDVEPDVTDDWVAENLSEYMEDSDYPMTVEGLRDFCAYKLYENDLEDYVDTYITDNTKVKSYPFLYLKNQYWVQDANYQYYVSYMNSLYGSTVYTEPYELLGLDDEKAYKKQLKSDAKDSTAYYLAYQAIYEDAGLDPVTEEEMQAYAEDQGSDYDTMVENYGRNYLAQQTLRQKTFDYVMTLIIENGDSSIMWVEDEATAADADAE